MWKQHVALVLIFVAAFLATFLAFSGSGLEPIDAPLEDLERHDRPDLGPRDGSPEDPARGEQGGPPDARLESEATEPGEGAAPGRIEGRVLDRHGVGLRDFGVELKPAAGRVAHNADGILEILDVPPGEYRLSVWAAGHVPTSRSPVTVEPGRTTEVGFRLSTGVRPRGFVFDEMDHQGVPGVLVEFGNGAKARTDSAGRFDVGRTVPPGALEWIRVTKKGYDVLVYKKHHIPDPQEILLGMTRGKCLILGRVANLSLKTAPPTFRVRLFLKRGGNIPPLLRREQVFRPSQSFRFEDVHYGQYVLLLDFPDSDWAARRRDVELRPGEQLNLDLAVAQGTDLAGRLLSDGVGNLASKLDLRFDDGMIACTVHSDAEGRFSFTSVEAGTYQVRVWRGRPCFDTAPIEIRGTGELRLDIDVDRRRLARR